MTRAMAGRASLGAAALALALLGGCGGKPEDEGGAVGGMSEALRSVAAQQLAELQGRRAAPAAARSDADVAAAALAANPNPLILVKMDSQGGRAQAMAMVGDNGGLRTYMTPNEQAVILRGGMLAGTRGLGHDLSVAEMGASAALIRAGRGGQAQRTMRYFTGEGSEGPLPLDCTITPAGGGAMVEDCRGAGGLAVRNTYVVQGGAIAASRQWIGPTLGYLDIVTLRP